MIGESAAWLGEQLKAHASELVVLKRGDLVSRLTASPCRSEMTAEVYDTAAIIDHELRDWICLMTDYVIDGVPVEPAVGDRLEHVMTHGTRIWEVGVLAGAPAWRWADAGGRLLRVHTRLIGYTDAGGNWIWLTA